MTTLHSPKHIEVARGLKVLISRATATSPDGVTT
jgi:hypothetical protein